MIVTTREGRHRSLRTIGERRSDIAHRWTLLSDEEKVVVNGIFDEIDFIANEGENGFESLDELLSCSQIYHGLANAHYVDRVAPIEEFILDDHYLGHIGKYVYKKWLEDLKELFSGRYTEAIFTGSIGSGKTTTCEIALCYMFYELCMLEDPQATYGLMPGSEIVLVCFNRDKRLARDVTYGGVKSKIERSPFFQDLRVTVGRSELIYEPKNIRIIAVSVRSADALGRNVFGGIVDETDHLEGSTLRGGGLSTPGTKSFAELLHESISRRMRSRYDRSGILPGKLLLSSSARNKDSFTNKRIGDASTDPSVFCRDYAIYDVKPEGNFSKDRFWVLVGNARIRDKILSAKEYSQLTEKEKEDMKEQGCNFLHVPENFRGDFERNIEGAIREIGGLVTVSVSPYIQLREKIYEAIDPTLQHPMVLNTWTTPEMPEINWDMLCHRVRRKISPGVFENVLEPRRAPQATRHVHIDLSLGKTDCAGLCISHVADMVDVERRSMEGGLVQEQVPIIEVDLILQIQAPVNGEIDIGSIRALVYLFVDHGFAFNYASLDSWQSAESIQKFRENGITASVVSVDKNMEPYDYLKLALYEGRLSYYNHPVLIEELEQLQRDDVKRKVIHPTSGSKDLADALAGTVYTLSTKMRHRAPLMMGISESEDPESEQSEWIRQTMTKAGDKAPELASDKASPGPLFFTR